MVIQVINLGIENIFKRYKQYYNIFKELYQRDLLALELRDLPNELGEKVFKLILDKNELCYKAKPNKNGKTDLLIPGSFSVFKEIFRDIVSSGNEDLGYRISSTLHNFSEYEKKSISLGNKDYPLNKAYVMGILNVTPDSFSDGGKYDGVDSAVAHAARMLEEGADIIDVGGESTRPGAERVPEDEELKRVIPVIEKIIMNNPEAVISIDTTKSKVATEALELGAKIINDISALSFDESMTEVAASYNVPVILMHIKGTPQTMQQRPFYEDVISEIYEYLQERITFAKKGGIKNLLVDPGIGFGKSVSDNYEIIRRLSEFKGLGFPILAGLSRKSFLGKSLNLGVGERDDVTAVAEAVAINNGARFIRTHNVKKAVQTREFSKYYEHPDLLNNG